MPPVGDRGLAYAPGSMNIDVTGRRAVVTGASKGIGAETVRALAESGASVAFCARGAEGVEALVAATKGSPVRGYVADASAPADLDRFLDAAEADLGGPADILVNIAGASPSRNFLHMSDEDWEDLFRLNLLSAVRCSRRVLPAMRKQRWGRIVNIASSAARYPNPATIDYAASKAAMLAMSKALARKYGADNVLVNAVNPGLILTPMWERAAGEIAAASGRTMEAVLDTMSATVPLGRYGTAREVADVIVFLCSEQASYVAGTVIEVDGASAVGV